MQPRERPPHDRRRRRVARATSLVAAISVLAGVGALSGSSTSPAEGASEASAAVGTAPGGAAASAPPRPSPPRPTPAQPAPTQPAPGASDPPAPGPTATGSRTEVRETATPARRLPIRTVNGTTYRPKATAAGTASKVTKPPTVRARSWVVADLDSGEILATRRHRAQLPQASTIKLLTAVTASRTVPAHPDHRVTWDEAHRWSCSCAGLQVGERYTRRALTAGMLLPSGNDASEALAGSHPQGREAFITAMNALAKELGASDTHVVTPSGLTARGARSSARDLLLFLRAARADPQVAPLLDRATFPFGPVDGKTRLVRRGTDYVNKYVAKNPGTQGKSGFTRAAGNTLVVDTPIGGRRIAVATLGSPAGESTKAARALTAWANANFSRLAAVDHLPAVGG